MPVSPRFPASHRRHCITLTWIGWILFRLDLAALLFLCYLDRGESCVLAFPKVPPRNSFAPNLFPSSCTMFAVGADI